ncbi:hypothetical protein HETIRDRAFT_420112 [Heterobasidion irregulare TC 32-1]|uniref:Uncharacterized protein n=1 Tax=Heterobasidion irregulare (strain TC 32-1) TaxID=747525 RepID=W4K1D9_HETIT|nr:uncharacterized protein HETIRDRAFT_420112 [Heterobasidion irregulare TC 32-1]ETW78896.1 hypothetical protein HETIRDRAFT_420112 [Heterobasidion irregulare TC 32-1]
MDGVAIVRKSKVGEKVLFAKVIGDGVAGSKERSSKVGQMVGVQKIGLRGINREMESWGDGIGDGGDCSKSARLRMREIDRSSDRFGDEGGVKKKVESGGSESDGEDSRSR